MSKRCPGGPERIHAITIIAVNVKSAMITVPAASPSSPSVRLTPFAAPAITRKSSTYQRVRELEVADARDVDARRQVLVVRGDRRRRP